jgi:hypothetical protein
MGLHKAQGFISTDMGPFLLEKHVKYLILSDKYLKIKI